LGVATGDLGWGSLYQVGNRVEKKLARGNKIGSRSKEKLKEKGKPREKGGARKGKS